MSLLTVVRDVCAVVGVTQPISVVAAIGSNRTMAEMLALANEMGQRIAYDTRDWQELQAAATNVGDAQWVPPRPDPGATWTGAEAFPLPANFKRMLLTATVRRSDMPTQSMRYVPDYDEWLWRRAQNLNDGRGEWIISGGKMLIDPMMPVGVNATYPYIDKNCVALASGGYGDRFQADADSFRLDERILKLGMIWQWKANKGSPYAEDMGTYSDAIATAMGHNKPAPIMVVGASYAYR